ncbi:MAG: hypothetical protein Q7T84_10770, partial [Phenylobacterium sp.]|nr:hypothetical protein [Phenylobacterium sp.]
RTTQEKLTKIILDGAKLDATRWPNLPARMIGDRHRDPPPPDPRSNKAREDRFWAVEAPRLLKLALRSDPSAQQSAASLPSPLEPEAAAAAERKREEHAPPPSLRGVTLAKPAPLRHQDKPVTATLAPAYRVSGR